MRSAGRDHARAERRRTTYLADSAQLQELQLKGSASGKNYIGPPGDAAGPQDREIVSFDGRTMVLRWMDSEVAGRYGTGVYVRCAAEGMARGKPAMKPQSNRHSEAERHSGGLASFRTERHSGAEQREAPRNSYSLTCDYGSGFAASRRSGMTVMRFLFSTSANKFYFLQRVYSLFPKSLHRRGPHEIYFYSRKRILFSVAA